jgi:hypothetical protein
MPEGGLRPHPELNLNSPESKKGTQIYFSIPSKVPADERPPGSPTGPP